MKRVLVVLSLLPWLLAATPGEISALDAQARDAFRSGEYTKAADLFGRILEALPVDDPTRARTQYNRGRALQEAGRDCAAAEALFGYLSNPVSDSRRETRRKVKAQANLERARTACDARKATARAATERKASGVSDRVEPRSPRSLVLQAGLGTGMHLTGDLTRARSTIQLGAGLQRDRWLWDINAEISLETPAGGEGLVMVRPGARLAASGPFYWRVSVPILIEPLLAAGLHGGAGLRWPATGQIAGLAEIGAIGWLSDPVQATLDARLGVQASF